MKLTDEELIAALEVEEKLALDARSGELQQERSEALRRYNGELLGNEVEGRSAIVDKGVMDTIQWIVPSLARIYLGGDDIGKFEPVGPEDEYAADCETEVCNWYLNNKNDIFSIVVASLTDALLLKNGYMVGYWNVDKSVSTETYTGLADEEVAMLMQDQDVTVVEHTEYPDPAPQMPQMQPGMPPAPPGSLHDVKVERKKADEYVGVDSAPPDELLVSRRHRVTSLLNCDFTQWRRRVSVGQLRSEGFKISDDQAAGYSDDLNQEHFSRERFEDLRQTDDTVIDPSRKIVLFKDTYALLDLAGTGIPKLWRAAWIDGAREFTLKEEAEIVPFAAFSPIIYPHSHVGTSVFDLINDLCLIKTIMERQLVDGVFQQNSGMKAVDINRVNMDDVLVTRPGGIVRVEGDPSTGIFPLVTPDVGPTIMGALEYLDGIKEQRTGVTRYSAGLDANTLNKTASGISAIQQAANQRIELIARTMASGFKDLFLIIHALASKHSTKPIQIKLKGEWKPIDPRQWAKRSDFSISVGLGTGNPDQQMQKLMLIGQSMQQAAPLGIAGPQEFYNWFVEFLKAAGYKNPSKFVIEPQKGPDGKAIPPPPQKDPMVQAQEIKSQSDMQIAQGKSQADMQMAQTKMQADSQVEQARASADMQVQQHKVQTDAQLEMAKHEMQMKFDDFRHQRDQETALQIEHIKAAASIEVARINAAVADGANMAKANADEAGMRNAADSNNKTHSALADTIGALHKSITGPRKIIRGKDGRAEGVGPAQ